MTASGGSAAGAAGAARSGGIEPPADDAPELIWLDGEGLEQFAIRGGRPTSTLNDEPAAAAPLSDAAPAPGFEGRFDAPPMGEEFGRYLAGRERSRVEWVQSASRAALLCVIAAAGADWFFGSLPPEAASRVAAAPPAASRVAAAPRATATRATPSSAPDTRDAVTPAPPTAVVVPPTDRPAVVPPMSNRPPVVTATAGDTRGPSARVPEGRPVPAAPVRPAMAEPAPPAVASRFPVPTTAAASAPIAAAPPAPAAAVLAELPAPPVKVAAVVDDPPVVLPAPETRVASAPAAAPAAPPTRELEARAIENVLSRYRTAFNRLDAGAASAVWPSVNEKNLARAFERLEDQNVSFDDCRIEVTASLAEAACNGSARYVPKVGNRTPKAESRKWNFSLRKGGTGWLIDRVDAR